MTSSLETLSDKAQQMAQSASELAAQAETLKALESQGGVDPFIFGLTVFVLACFIGYYVVWKVTPALHTPLMAVTNAISGIVLVGAMIAAGLEGSGISQFLGFMAVTLASVNIFGGFVVTQRMLEMFKKKSG